MCFANSFALHVGTPLNASLSRSSSRGDRAGGSFGSSASSSERGSREELSHSVRYQECDAGVFANKRTRLTPCGVALCASLRCTTVVVYDMDAREEQLASAPCAGMSPCAGNVWVLAESTVGREETVPRDGEGVHSLHVAGGEQKRGCFAGDCSARSALPAALAGMGPSSSHRMGSKSCVRETPAASPFWPIATCCASAVAQKGPPRRGARAGVITSISYSVGCAGATRPTLRLAIKGGEHRVKRAVNLA